MSEPAIRVEGLSKQYRITHGVERAGYRTLRETLVNTVTAPFRKRATTEEFWALKDVSFEVQPGEVVGIIGRNGAGKSTLLKILSRITKPTTGRVELNGRVGSLLEVGTGFHPELTGRENVYLNGSILGMSRAEVKKKFDEIVEFAEVEKFLDTPVKRYSSGMYVRLAFAVAAHLEPEILIVDEVLAVGDTEFQKKCLDKMNAVRKSGRTVLFVSHNMAAVENLCDAGILLASGNIVARGEIQHIIAEYQKQDRRAGDSLIDLARHPNRQGNPNACLQRLRISSDGVPTARVRMGDPLELVIEYDCGEKASDLRLGITIENARGVKIVSFSPTFQSPEMLRNAESSGAVRCSIPSTPLVEGFYSVHVYYLDGTRSDSVEHSCHLEVQAADVFKTGRIPDGGVVFHASHWTFEHSK